jgi:hypothetical protein
MGKIFTAVFAGGVTVAAAMVATVPIATAAPQGGSTHGAQVSGTWAKRLPADLVSGRPEAMTCRSERFCVLADTYGAILIKKDGHWQHSYQLPRHDLLVDDISCASTSLCVASGQNWTGESGFVMTYDGSVWSKPVFVSSTSVVGVSCVSTTWCMAVDYHSNLYLYDGTSWSPAGQIAAGEYVYRISCVTSSFCVVMNDLGGPWMYDGTGWTFDGYDGDYEGYSLQCLSTTWCVITSTYGVRTWDGTQWTYGDAFTQTPLVGTSCSSTTFCLAVDDLGGTYAFDGSTWQPAGSIAETNPVVVQCLSDRTCYETGWSGEVYRYSGAAWNDGIPVDPPAGSPTSLSCPTDDFCMLLDEYGNAVRFTNGVWGRPHNHHLQGVARVSCATASLCVVVDEGSQAFVVRDRHWSHPMQLGIGALTGVSCVASGVCVAVSDAGRSVTYDGGSWSTPTSMGAHDVRSISCTSASFCMAMTIRGRTVSYDGQGWRDTGSTVAAAIALSCSSATFCMAVGYHGEYNRWDGSEWTGASYLVDSHVFDVSCPIDGFCQVLASGNNVYSYTGHWAKTAWLGSFANGPYSVLACTTTVTCTALDPDGWARRYA